MSQRLKTIQPLKGDVKKKDFNFISCCLTVFISHISLGMRVNNMVIFLDIKEYKVVVHGSIGIYHTIG